MKNAKDIDDKKGIVSFYFADFNSVDSHGRKMNSMAFNRTINNNFKRFAHLLNHNPSTIIGKPMEVGTDAKGAYMVSQLSKNTYGRDALILYQEGVYNEHSFGFQIIKSEMEKNVEIVNELKMFEASTVTWGANEYTPTISINTMEDLLKNSKLSDDILIKLDKLLARFPVADQHEAPQDSFNYEELKDYIKNY
jgi:HK97 family phage prohead protease